MNIIDHIKSSIDKNIRKEIMGIALPAMFETLCTTLTGIIDSQMVSSLGTDAISAIAVTNQPKLFLFCCFLAINTVISSSVANYIGKKDKKSANIFFVTAISAIIIGSIVVGLIAILAARPILLVCSGQKNTMDMSITYFRIIMGGMIFNHLYTAINAELRGCGNTKVSLYTSIVSCVTNIFFNYVLINGNLGFPALGIAGAAIATVIGTAAAFAVSLIWLGKSDAFISMKYCAENKIRANFAFVKESVSMWKHVLVENLMTRTGFLISSAITARIGSFEMSVYAVGMHLMDVNYAIANGFQSAAVAIVGRCRGADEREKIDGYARRMIGFGLIFGLILSGLIVTFARPYYSLFSTDEVFIQTGIYVCGIIAVISPIQIVKIIHTGLLQGLGKMQDTKKAAIISVTITQPICNFLFTMLIPLGLWGIWISSFVSQLVWFITSRIYYVKYKKTGFINV